MDDSNTQQQATFSCLLVCGGTASVGAYYQRRCMRDADTVVRRNPNDIYRVEKEQQRS